MQMLSQRPPADYEKAALLWEFYRKKTEILSALVKACRNPLEDSLSLKSMSVWNLCNDEAQSAGCTPKDVPWICCSNNTFF